MGLISADDAVNTTVMVAQAMTDYADIWPENIETSMVMGRGSGGPFSLAEGGNKWRDAAAKLEEAQAQLTALCAGLPRDYWDGADRDRFDTEIQQLEAQLGDSHNYAMAVGITLDALAVPIGAWPVECMIIGGIEFYWASTFYATAASVVGDFGPAEAVWASGVAATAATSAVMNASAAILIAIMAAATAAIAIADIADIAAQMHNGDTGILAEFGKATVDSAGEVALNVAVDRMNNHKGGEHEGGEEGPPGKHAAPEGKAPEGETPTGKSPEGETPTGKSPEGQTPKGESPTGESPNGDSSPQNHAPRHAKPPDWKETYHERRNDWLKEKGREKGGELANKPLSDLINGVSNSVGGGWNDPDAPDASGEDWGEGE